MLNSRSFQFLLIFNLFIFNVYSCSNEKLEHKRHWKSAKDFIRNSNSEGFLSLIQRNPNLYGSCKEVSNDHYWMASKKRDKHESRAAISLVSFVACAISGWTFDSSGLRTASLFSLLFSGYYWNKVRHANKIHNKLNELDVWRENKFGPE